MLTLALAGLAYAQSASGSTSSVSQSSSTALPSSTPPSSARPSKTSVLLPFYPPYPVSDASVNSSSSPIPSSSALSGSHSSSITRRRTSTTSTATDNQYWQHTYRDYYVSIITVISSSTIVYAIDCAPNSAHPSYSNVDFQSFSVCAAGVVGRGPMTVTQGPDQWNFAYSQTEGGFNLTQTGFNGTSTTTWLDITCDALGEKTKTCKNVVQLTSSASAISSSLDDGASAQQASEVSSLLENFSTMSPVLVTVTAGVEKLPQSSKFPLPNSLSQIESL